MITEFVDIQFGNHIAVNRVVAMLTPSSAPTRRLIEEYESKGLLLDMTNGRRRQAVILLDTGHAVLAAITPETIVVRLTKVRQSQQNQVAESA